MTTTDSILDRDGAHVRRLMAVHPGLTAELASPNRGDLAHVSTLDHLQRHGA